MSDSRAKPSCWRVQNIPTSWTASQLLQKLRQHHQSLTSLEEGWLSIYPAYTGNSQTALLNMGRPPQYFRDLDTDQSHTMILVGPKLAGRKENDVFLGLDCHFLGLTPLNVPAGENIVDVVAVTGLSGHAFGSWRSRQSYEMWLKDFLPSDIPRNLRILTYGYNSSLTQPGKRELAEYRRSFIQCLSNARSTKEERARPLVLIGHSLGCIVIAQGLLQSQNIKEDGHILDSTRLVVLFGAPHLGLNVDALVSMVQDITSTSASNKQSARLRLLLQLREDSDFLHGQSERLISIWKKLKIISFYETLETKTVGKNDAGQWERRGDAINMLKTLSALLCLEKESRYPIIEDHTNMVKFARSDDKIYESVVGHIRECVECYSKAR